VPDPQLLQAAKDVGGWVFAAVSIALMAGFYVRQISTGALVPGPLLTKALDANDRLVEAMGRVTGSVETLTTQTTTAIRELRDDIRELRQARSPGRD
jgi:hypothetical protein